MDVLARLVLAAVLAAAASAKVARPDATRAALATFGVRGERARTALWGSVVAAESLLAAGIAAAFDPAAYAAAALMLAFAGAILHALARGRAGAACGCFGPRSRVGRAAAARALALAAAFAALPSLPPLRPGPDGWLALGLAVALAAVAALAVAVVALAREIGELRLRVAPASALELADEGPELGERTRLIERFAPGPAAELALAVFSSDGCRLCRTLEPVVAALARDPLLAVEVFEERRDADAWHALNVPGSPFAVALELDGTVRAKGTFNSFAQLESVLAAAERRRLAEVYA